MVVALSASPTFPALANSYPVNTVEERVLAKGTVRTTEACIGDLVEELDDEGISAGVFHVSWELKGLLEDFLINLIGVFSVLPERYIARHELIDYDSQ